MRQLLFSIVLILMAGLVGIGMASEVHAETVVKAAFMRGHNVWIKIGSAEKQVTHDGKVYTLPEWSYDGRWIAYSNEDGIWSYDVASHKYYHVYHEGGHNYQWAPKDNRLAFQDGKILDLIDLNSGKPARFSNVSFGVGQYSWTPDGKQFLASSIADLLPDGWTQPVLYRIGNETKIADKTQNVNRFFLLPGSIKKGNVSITSIGTSRFKWSYDGKWISFLVHPTASWSMDSNMLCVISADGKTFEPIDEMASFFPFRWAPSDNLLAYIEGSGRIVFGFKNKHLKLKEMPVFQEMIVTPKHYVDLGFTWINDEHIVTSRTHQQEWSNDPNRRPLPNLYIVDILSKTTKQFLSHPMNYGDFHPEYVSKNQLFSWVRSNRKVHDVWLSSPDGTNPHKWIENIDTITSISFYNPQLTD